MRNRGNLAKPRRNASWRRRDWAIMFSRALIAVLAVAGLFAMGKANQPVYGPPKAPHGPYSVGRPTEVERLTHDVRLAWEIEQAQKSGWGAH